MCKVCAYFLIVFPLRELPLFVFNETQESGIRAKMETQYSYLKKEEKTTLGTTDLSPTPLCLE